MKGAGEERLGGEGGGGERKGVGNQRSAVRASLHPHPQAPEAETVPVEFVEGALRAHASASGRPRAAPGSPAGGAVLSASHGASTFSGQPACHQFNTARFLPWRNRRQAAGISRSPPQGLDQGDPSLRTPTSRSPHHLPLAILPPPGLPQVAPLPYRAGTGYRVPVPGTLVLYPGTRYRE